MTNSEVVQAFLDASNGYLPAVQALDTLLRNNGVNSPDRIVIVGSKAFKSIDVLGQYIGLQEVVPSTLSLTILPA